MIRFVSLVAVFFLTGCISLVPPAKDLPPRYTLNASVVESSGTRMPVTLAIADARAEGAINTSRIAVRTAPNEIRYLPEGEWSDRVPRVFSLLVERSFEEQGRLLAVSDRVALPLADYVLFTDIQRFEAVRHDADRHVEVTFRVRLENRTGRVLAARRFDATEPMQSDDTAGAATALDAAAARATLELSEWAIGELERVEGGV